MHCSLSFCFSFYATCFLHYWVQETFSFIPRGTSFERSALVSNVLRTLSGLGNLPLLLIAPTRRWYWSSLLNSSLMTDVELVNGDPLSLHSSAVLDNILDGEEKPCSSPVFGSRTFSEGLPGKTSVGSSPCVKVYVPLQQTLSSPYLTLPDSHFCKGI